MNIHINDNQTEATINGVEYLLTPKETTVSKQEELPKREKITIENCREMIAAHRNKISGDVTSQAAAWCVVHDFLSQRGFDAKNVRGKCGIEFVIAFLDEALPEAKESKQETYTIAQLKSEKIAVRCDNNIQSGTFSTELGLIGLACYPIRVFWNSHLLRWDWILFTGNTVRHNFTKTIPFSQVQFPEKIESKKPLFKTEDGVEIYEGDEYWYMLPQDDENPCKATATAGSYNSDFIRFSEYHNVLKYISDNKPEYSKRQILEALDFTDLRNAYPSTYNLIKQKLGL